MLLSPIPGPRPAAPQRAEGAAGKNTWQSEADTPERQVLIEHIYNLFKKKRPNFPPEWAMKFPDFVRRLEEALYRNAPSKAEYVDVSTLELRLQEVAKKMHVPKSGARAQSGSQTPGTPGHSSSSSGAPQPNGLLSTTSNSAQSNMFKTPNGMGAEGKAAPMGGHALNGVSEAGPSQAVNGAAMGFGGPTRPGGPPGAAATGVGGLGPPQNTAPSNGLLSPLNSQPSAGFPPANGSSDLQQQHARELAQLTYQHSAQNEKLAAQQLQQQAALRMVPPQQGPAAPANGTPPLMHENSMGSPPTPGGHLPGTPQQGLPTGGLPGGDGRPAMDVQMRQKQYQKQQRWLLLLRHVSKCTAPEGTCTAVAHCYQAKQLWAHILQCQDTDCKFDSRCMPSKTLVKHNTSCRDQRCPVCQPVREILHQQRQMLLEAAARQAEEMQGGAKRQRIEPPAAATAVPVPLPKTEEGPGQGFPVKTEGVKTDPGALKFEPGVGGRAPVATKTELPGGAGLKSETSGGYGHAGVSGEGASEQGGKMVVVEPNRGVVQGGAVAPHAVEAAGAGAAKGGKAKVQGTSLTELFTQLEIKNHIRSLRAWIYQQPPPPKGKGAQQFALRVDPNNLPEDACQLCGTIRLSFEPPPLYCTPCGARVKRNGWYHFVMAGTDTKHVVCTQCFQDQRGDTVDIEGHHFPKAKLEKKKNDEEVEEAWVQCDRCNKWNHQICALFNGRRNESDDTEYTCPECLYAGLVEGKRQPLPPSAVLMAKDLPKTHLSNFLEERLQRRLVQERAERAAGLGKRVDQVPTADGLVVRVVSSVDKKLEVKSKFAELFQAENYASDFPYKSKVVLLYQKIEGVEILLFGMYTQEFGTDADAPNTRRMYLSYLDSVKYFRPEVRTIHGEALRTYVYHEILIGYLEYTKLRGFNSVYIWACPPLKGEDYILYCHPETQKTPKSDKLREWYLSMLRKASREGIVVETTNMFDMFFVKGEESRVPVTAARLPYFDGDYWPGAAEDMIAQMEAEHEEAIRNRGKTVKKKGKAAVKGKGKVPLMMELPTNATRDQMLMQKLGEAIGPMKEDFIMVHMHPTCSHCRDFIMFGNRWSCRGPNCDFRLCDGCHAAENARPMELRHPLAETEKHTFFAQPVAGVPQDTRDPDTEQESEFFDTRQAFLSLCQGNHYQYDTLRRAKHSSMMVLYHLHNPSAPAFVSSCNVCQKDIEAGRGFRCEVCPDFDICSNCMDLGHKHPHPMTAHPTAEERSGQNLFAREQRMVALRKWMDLLLHASDCKAPLRSCSYPKCLTIRLLFRHGMQCEKKAPGGCAHCRRMWMLLKMHSRLCKQNPCPVPRCKDLKEHWQLMQRQSETRRRYNYKEMMRQRQEEDS